MYYTRLHAWLQAAAERASADEARTAANTALSFAEEAKAEAAAARDERDKVRCGTVGMQCALCTLKACNTCMQ